MEKREGEKARGREREGEEEEGRRDGKGDERMRERREN